MQGASFVECDVVLTKDCQLICRHEPDLVATTDAKTKFPDLVKNYTIDSTLSGRVSPESISLVLNVLSTSTFRYNQAGL